MSDPYISTAFDHNTSCIDKVNSCAAADTADSIDEAFFEVEILPEGSNDDVEYLASCSCPSSCGQPGACSPGPGNPGDPGDDSFDDWFC